MQNSLIDQSLMLVSSYPIMIYIFIYSNFHVCHKLTATYIATPDAVIIFSSFLLCGYWKKVGSSCNVLISKLYKVLSEETLVTLSFFDVTYVTLF